MNTRYIPPARFVAPSGAFKKPTSPATERIDDGRLYASRTSPPHFGYFASAITIEGMPHGGATFIDGTRADDSRSSWRDASFRQWSVPATVGPHEVVVVAPNGERRVGTANAPIGFTPDWRPELTWATMKVLPPVNPALGGYGDGKVRASGFIRPSGALSVAQVANAQGILVWLGHLPRNVSSITGARDSLTGAAVLRFQQNYNAENACRRNPSGAGCHPPYSNSGFQPASIDVDGDLGPQTIAALANYNLAAARAGYGLGITEAQLRTLGGAAAQGAGSGPAAVTNSTTIETTPASTTAVTHPPAPRPAPTPAPQRQAPSEPFPTGPLLAVVAGAAVIAGAVWYRRGSSKRKGG